MNDDKWYDVVMSLEPRFWIKNSPKFKILYEQHFVIGGVGYTVCVSQEMIDAGWNSDRFSKIIRTRQQEGKIFSHREIK